MDSMRPSANIFKGLGGELGAVAHDMTPLSDYWPYFYAQVDWNGSQLLLGQH